MKRISNIGKRAASTILALTLASGSQIQATDTHKFHVADLGWKSVAQLNVVDCDLRECRVRGGTELLPVLRLQNQGRTIAQFCEQTALTTQPDAKPSDSCVNITNIEPRQLVKPVDVYDFSVEDYHTYYVGSDWVLTHNAGSDDFDCKKALMLGLLSDKSKYLKQVDTYLSGPDKSHFIDDIENLFGKKLDLLSPEELSNSSHFKQYIKWWESVKGSNNKGIIGIDGIQSEFNQLKKGSESIIEYLFRVGKNIKIPKNRVWEAGKDFEHWKKHTQGLEFDGNSWIPYANQNGIPYNISFPELSENMELYINAADNFFSKKCNAQCIQLIHNNKTIYRFNPATNEFGIIGTNGKISSYYKLEDGFSKFKSRMSVYDGNF